LFAAGIVIFLKGHSSNAVIAFYTLVTTIIALPNNGQLPGLSLKLVLRKMVYGKDSSCN
jgi:hypothetical protein